MTFDARTLFRTVAFAEAVSWAALLVSMYVKYGPADNPTFVSVFGMVHGIVFLGYVGTVLLVRERFGWDVRTFLLAGLSSVPPFCTALFEVLADRRGLLVERTGPARARADENASVG